jgi:hypothetical protein
MRIALVVRLVEPTLVCLTEMPVLASLITLASASFVDGPSKEMPRPAPVMMLLAMCRPDRLRELPLDRMPITLARTRLPRTSLRKPIRSSMPMPTCSSDR